MCDNIVDVPLNAWFVMACVNVQVIETSVGKQLYHLRVQAHQKSKPSTDCVNQKIPKTNLSLMKT
jgi:hypothetical protein